MCYVPGFGEVPLTVRLCGQHVLPVLQGHTGSLHETLYWNI